MNLFPETNLKEKAKKYPFHGKDKYLIDKFLIIGYEKPIKSYLSSIKNHNQNQGKNTESLSFMEQNNFNSNLNLYEFPLLEYPIILNDISSNYSKISLDNEQIIEMIFPNKPYLYVSINNEKRNKPINYSVVFNSNPHDGKNSKKSINGLAYIFYKEYYIEDKKTILFFPCCFCIISEYPFFYSFLNLIEIVKELFNKKINIPIEIILYNIIAFTPSPINQNIEIDFNKKDIIQAPTLRATTYTNQAYKKNFMNQNLFNERQSGSIKKLLPKIHFDLLSGYPIFECNLSKILLNNLSSSVIVEIFIYTLLEKDIIFFSKNMEYLSLIIYSFINLNYPLNDSEYYWINASVSFETLMNENSPFVGKTFSSMIGVNDNYDADLIKKCNHIKNHILIDLDKGVVYNKNNKNDIILNTVKKYCKSGGISKKEKNILNVSIKKLYNKLEEFKLKLKNQNKTKFLDYDENIKSRNREIQEEFYQFILKISIYFYQNLCYIVKILDAGTIQFDKEFKKYNYFPEEKTFLTQMKDTMKFDSFVSRFIQSYETIDLYKIPFSFTEEYISLLNNKFKPSIENCFTDSFNFLENIDSLYLSNIKNSKQNLNINFELFDEYYYNNLEKKFKRYLFEYIGKTYEIKEKGQQFINSFNNLKYISYNLNNEILMLYINFIGNQKIEELIKIFPHYKQLIENKIISFEINDIENLIEKNAIDKHTLDDSDIICTCILILFCLSIQLLNAKDLNFLYPLLTSIFTQHYFIFRKYYSLMCDIFCRLLEDANNKNLTTKKLTYINFYYPMLNKFTNENIFPNEILFTLIKRISILESQKGFYNSPDNELNFFQFDETFTQPKFLYDLKIDQKLNIINFYLKKENLNIDCRLFDINYLFKNLVNIMINFIEDLNQDKIEEETETIIKYIINIIYYVETQNKLSNERLELCCLLIKLLYIIKKINLKNQ